MTLSYVRTQEAPKLPTPASSASLLAKLIERFVPTPLSGFGTLVIASLLGWAIWSIFQWAIINAVWIAADREP